MLDWIRRNILTEEVVIEVIHALRRRLEERAKTAGPDLSKLESEATKLRKEIANGVDSLVKMGHSPAVAAAVAEREVELQRIEGRIEAAKAALGAIDLETRRLESEARDRLVKLRELLESKPIEARKAMEALVDGPIYFKPEFVEEKRRYRVTGTIAWADLICPTLSDPKGI